MNLEQQPSITLKLFKVKDLFFDNKMEAREYRNKLIEAGDHVAIQRGSDNPASARPGRSKRFKPRGRLWNTRIHAAVTGE